MVYNFPTGPLEVTNNLHTWACDRYTKECSKIPQLTYIPYLEQAKLIYSLWNSKSLHTHAIISFVSYYMFLLFCHVYNIIFYSSLANTVYTTAILLDRDIHSTHKVANSVVEMVNVAWNSTNLYISAIILFFIL